MPKLLPDGLVVRELTRDDIPALADLLTTAPDDGTLYQFPRVRQYPEIMNLLYIQWLRDGIRDRDSLTRIAMIPQDGARAKVIGFSCWYRREPDPEALGSTKCLEWRQASWGESLEATLLALESRYKTFYHWFHPKKDNPALSPDIKRQEGMFVARSRAPSPKRSTPCFELSGLAVHPEFQRFGIATMLVKWGLDEAAKAGVPVFTAGEDRGVEFYTNALGFRRLPENEYWLDSNGNGISREEVEARNESWKRINGGLSGCELVWCPEGVLLDDDGYILTV